MAKRIVYKNSDDGISIVIPADPGADIESVALASVPEGVAYSVVDESEVPSDRYFRDAWTHGGESIVVDIEKAKEIKKNELRRLRRPLLEKLDVEFMVALERGDSAKVAEVSAKKQELRDITSAAGIEEAKTAEELKAFIPTALGGM